MAAPCSADQGALVIKIEPPEGDNLRNYPSTLAQESRAFLGVNRNKHGIGLDLKHPDGLGVLRRMVGVADVLVHNFRPSVPPRLGIDYDRMKVINPRLIYCALTGYGDTGPLKDRAGYDQVLADHDRDLRGAGKAGRSADRVRVRRRFLLGVDAGVRASRRPCSSAAAPARASTWGCRCCAARSRCKRPVSSGRTARVATLRGTCARAGSRAFIRRSSGSLYISANTPHFWTALCELTGLPELASDPRFDTVKKRAQHAGELVPRIRAALQARTAVEWEALFGERVPCAAARAVEDMFEHPQVASEGILASFEHPRIGRYRAMAHPIHFGAGPAPAPVAAPELGQHSREILARLGFADEEIERLRSAGAVVGPSKGALA